METHPLLVSAVSTAPASLSALNRFAVTWIGALLVRSSRDSDVLKVPSIFPFVDLSLPTSAFSDCGEGEASVKNCNLKCAWHVHRPGARRSSSRGGCS